MSMIGVIPYWARTKIAEMLTDSTADHVYYIAWGTGTTAAAATDTTLETEIERAAATITDYGDGYTLYAIKAFTIAAAYTGYAASEAGVFDADGNLIYRGLFSMDGYTASARTVSTGDILQVKLYLIIQQGTL